MAIRNIVADFPKARVIETYPRAKFKYAINPARMNAFINSNETIFNR
jgi:hypothetical protein